MHFRCCLPVFGLGLDGSILLRETITNHQSLTAQPGDELHASITYAGDRETAGLNNHHFTVSLRCLRAVPIINNIAPPHDHRHRPGDDPADPGADRREPLLFALAMGASLTVDLAVRGRPPAGGELGLVTTLIPNCMPTFG